MTVGDILKVARFRRAPGAGHFAYGARSARSEVRWELDRRILKPQQAAVRCDEARRP